MGQTETYISSPYRYRTTVNSAQPVSAHIQNPDKGRFHPRIAAVGCPTVSAGLVGVAAPMEAGTGWVGGQEVEAMVRQDGSNLSRAVGYLCLYRT